MIDGAPFGSCNDYPGLQQIMRLRAEHLQVSRQQLDEITGLAEGHCDKLLSNPPRKNMGILSLGIMLQALGLKLLVVEDPEMMRRLASRMIKRQENHVRVRAKPRIVGAPWLFNSRKGRHLRKTQLLEWSREELSQINRKAAKRRWKRWRQEQKRGGFAKRTQGMAGIASR